MYMTPPFVCEACNFSAPTRSRFSKHLSTQKNSLLTTPPPESAIDAEAEPESVSEPEPESVSEPDSEPDSEPYEDNFRCYECRTVAPHNWCFRCGREDICETCEGDGGDYGAREEWVCYSCLPSCLKCAKKLFVHDDDCCGAGRSDFTEDADPEEKESEQGDNTQMDNIDFHLFSEQLHKDILHMISMQDIITHGLNQNAQHFGDLRAYLNSLHYNLLLVLPIVTALCGFYAGRNW